MSKPAAVLWDMDGTLVDTEPYWIDCERELVHAHGGTWTDADGESLVGSDLIDAAGVLREHGVALPAEQIVEELIDGVLERIDGHLPWQPGARELLLACRDAGVPCALVTMSWRRFVDPIVASAPPGAFTATVAGDEVPRGKPHPDPYERAAELLGAEPSACVAVEDSPTGVASALAAGCATLGVPHVVPLAPADGLTVVESLVGLDVDDLARLVGH